METRIYWNVKLYLFLFYIVSFSYQYTSIFLLIIKLFAAIIVV